MCWIAEKIAEQRLLWRLRNESELLLHYPDDMSAEDATTLARAELQREADRHMKWIIIDGLLFVASGVFFLVPGPNLIAYYFGFRLVGHYLSRRGAPSTGSLRFGGSRVPARSCRVCAASSSSRPTSAIAKCTRSRRRCSCRIWRNSSSEPR